MKGVVADSAFVSALTIVILDVSLFFIVGAAFYYFSFVKISLDTAMSASVSNVLWRVLYLQVIFQFVLFAIGHRLKMVSNLGYSILVMFSSVLISALIMKKGDLLASLMVFSPRYFKEDFASGFTMLLTGVLAWYTVQMTSAVSRRD
ncbi:MAG: hypothetical protein KF765_05480 [Parvibaculaceae bacterium]|nr:hypothetical protein [Parvibaculaceae bacterium]